MSNYINQVSDSLKNHISELANNPCLFLRNPNVDFSRKRKIDFKTFIGIMSRGAEKKVAKKPSFLYLRCLQRTKDSPQSKGLSYFIKPYSME